MTMIDRLFPTKEITSYRGHPIAKWSFVVITLITVIRSLIHIVFPDGGLQVIATVPLDQFTNDGARAVIFFGGLWGISQLLISLFYVIVLWRYRAFIPLMYLSMLLEYGSRILLAQFKHLPLTGVAPGGIGSYGILIVTSLLFVLSLQHRNATHAS